MSSCKETSRLISEGEERRLSISERIELRLHLLACKSCRNFGRQIRFLRDTLHRNHQAASLPVEPTPMPEDARERIRKAMMEQLTKER